MHFLNFASVDGFAKAAALVTILLLLSLMFPPVHRWIVSREDDDRSGVAFGGILLALTVAGVAAVIVAAILGPHPA